MLGFQSHKPATTVLAKLLFDWSRRQEQTAGRQLLPSQASLNFSMLIKFVQAANC